MSPTVPYITAWSGERKIPALVLPTRTGHGIRYSDETIADRDHHGILWARVESRPGTGNPTFGKIHSLRQRRVMRHLRCQVCAGPPDRNDQGVLWLMADYQNDWPNWPNGMATNDAPLCLPCAHTAARLCPRMRRDHVLIRSKHHPISGIRGVRYRPTPSGLTPTEDATIAHDDPAIRWTVAHQLIRELFECTVMGTAHAPN